MRICFLLILFAQLTAQAASINASAFIAATVGSDPVFGWSTPLDSQTAEMDNVKSGDSISKSSGPFKQNGLYVEARADAKPGTVKSYSRVTASPAEFRLNGFATSFAGFTDTLDFSTFYGVLELTYLVRGSLDAELSFRDPPPSKPATATGSIQGAITFLTPWYSVIQRNSVETSCSFSYSSFAPNYPASPTCLNSLTVTDGQKSETATTKDTDARLSYLEIFRIPFTNARVNLNASLSTSALAFAYPDAGAQARMWSDAFQSAYLGSARVLTPDGRSVMTGATITSASGYDYTIPVPSDVPEPGTALLATLGLAVVARCQLAKRQ